MKPSQERMRQQPPDFDSNRTSMFNFLYAAFFYISSVFEKDDTAILSLLDVGYNRVSEGTQIAAKRK